MLTNGNIFVNILLQYCCSLGSIRIYEIRALPLFLYNCFYHFVKHLASVFLHYLSIQPCVFRVCIDLFLLCLNGAHSRGMFDRFRPRRVYLLFPIKERSVNTLAYGNPFSNLSIPHIAKINIGNRVVSGVVWLSFDVRLVQ